MRWGLNGWMEWCESNDDDDDNDDDNDDVTDDDKDDDDDDKDNDGVLLSISPMLSSICYSPYNARGHQKLLTIRRLEHYTHDMIWWWIWYDV